MRFIVDAQLPRRMARWLAARGHDVLHTLDLADGNRTLDSAIIERACQDDRTVVTKDADFVNSYLLTRRPPKLLLVATGNISNADLQHLLEQNIEILEEALASHPFIELGRDSLVIHQ
jgi:predicted nuclease of predicted toxin-antitoxin system